MPSTHHLAAALAAASILSAAAPSWARVTDPTAINTLDLRFDAGLATPVGAVGGAFSVPWRYFALELAGGVGLTGVNLSVMPKVIPVRWDRNQLMVGVAATVSLPLQSEAWPMGRRRSTWLTAEVAFQRTVFVDNILYIGVGATRGSYWSQCLNSNKTNCPAETPALWPEVRVGFGRRY